MSKVIAMLLLHIVLATAQSEEIQYSQGQLAIEIKKTVIASYNDWDAFLSSSMPVGGAGLAIRESKKWVGYKGGIEISEWKFYETAGLYEYAKRARSYKSKKDLFTYGGLTLLVMGGAIGLHEAPGFLHALLYPERLDYPEANVGPLFLAATMQLVGLTFTIIGVTKPPKLTVASFAVGVADEYNRNLRRTLEERR